METALAPRAPGLRLAGVGAAYKEQLCDLLDNVALFAELPWSDIVALSGYVSALEADPGCIVFTEGMPGNALYVLVRGRVETRKAGDTKCGTMIASDVAGKAIGEMALVDGEPRSATCTVMEPSVLLCLTRDHLERLAERHPMLAYTVMLRVARLLSRRLRATSGRLVEFLDA